MFSNHCRRALVLTARRHVLRNQSRWYCKPTPPSMAPPAEIKVMFGTQTGTSQLFAMQLADEISAAPELESCNVAVSSLGETPPESMIERKGDDDDDALVFLVSVTGVGQPSDNAREFMDWVHSPDAENSPLVRDRKYAVFGLGNAKTHSENYNIVGKKLDKRLEDLGAVRIHSMGLGDDSDCIEDDFDNWSQSLLQKLATLDETCSEVDAPDDTKDASDLENDEGAVCLGELAAAESAKAHAAGRDTTKHKPSNFPDLVLEEYPEGRRSLVDLFDLDQDGSGSFYMPGTKKLKVLYNKHIAPNRESLHEASLSLEDHPHMTYEVGDHIFIYPQNHPSQVAAYVQAVGAHPHHIIRGVEEGTEKKGTRPYPFPLGMTVAETLTHCVDLSAAPSPTLARFILGSQVDYKRYVAEPRRTSLDLLNEPGSRKLTLSELLYQLPMMAPRYYSISSSPLSHPREVLMTYRPVKYICSRGVLREGVTTSYLNAIRPAYDDDEDGEHTRVYTPHVAAGLRSNPQFRLPDDPEVPLVLVAGGCGIAPIRSFLDERLAVAKGRNGTKGVGGVDKTKFGSAHLFFGVRTDDDEVYHSMIDHALSQKVLSSAHIAHSSSCTNPRFVASDIEDNSEAVFDCLERGGHIYLCGGAVGFAPGCATAIKSAIAEHGRMSAEEAEEYYMNLVRTGRYAEDISE